MKKQKFSLEANGGGDYLIIEEKGNELILLEIGNCCVPTIGHILPLPVITSALTQWILSHDNDFEQAIKSQGWNDDYTAKLIKKFKEANA